MVKWTPILWTVVIILGALSISWGIKGNAHLELEKLSLHRIMQNRKKIKDDLVAFGMVDNLISLE